MVITIRRMQKEEREQTAVFVNQEMQKQYRCDAHELPELAFVAFRADVLVGVVALSMSDGELLPIERIYALAYATFPGTFNRLKIVQFGRWVATVSDVSEALVYAAVLYALQEGREWGMGEIKPPVARRFARMGIQIVPLSGEPILEKIPSAVLPYYLAPPKPMPCVLSLGSTERVLRERIASLAAQNRVKIIY